MRTVHQCHRDELCGRVGVAFVRCLSQSPILRSRQKTSSCNEPEARAGWSAEERAASKMEGGCRVWGLGGVARPTGPEPLSKDNSFPSGACLGTSADWILSACTELMLFQHAQAQPGMSRWTHVAALVAFLRRDTRPKMMIHGLD